MINWVIALSNESLTRTQRQRRSQWHGVGDAFSAYPINLREKLRSAYVYVNKQIDSKQKKRNCCFHAAYSF